MKYQIAENTLMEPFVSPELCDALVIAGLDTLAVYNWKITEGRVTLFTLAFDTDLYSKQATLNTEFINGSKWIPAYQYTDLQKILPDYMLSRNNDQFELHCDQLFEYSIETASRMPDVFAKMVIQGINSGKINLSKAIEKIKVKH